MTITAYTEKDRPAEGAEVVWDHPRRGALPCTVLVCSLGQSERQPDGSRKRPLWLVLRHGAETLFAGGGLRDGQIRPA